MTRKILISLVAIVSLTFGAFASGASAQGDYDCVVTDTCIEYPNGGFGGTVKPTPTPKPKATPTAAATTTTATGATTQGGATIAFTGAESAVLGYVGTGLIGFGAIAVIAARRKASDES